MALSTITGDAYTLHSKSFLGRVTPQSPLCQYRLQESVSADGHQRREPVAKRAKSEGKSAMNKSLVASAVSRTSSNVMATSRPRCGYLSRREKTGQSLRAQICHCRRDHHQLIAMMSLYAYGITTQPSRARTTKKQNPAHGTSSSEIPVYQNSFLNQPTPGQTRSTRTTHNTSCARQHHFSPQPAGGRTSGNALSRRRHGPMPPSATQ